MEDPFYRGSVGAGGKWLGAAIVTGMAIGAFAAMADSKRLRDAEKMYVSRNEEAEELHFGVFSVGYHSLKTVLTEIFFLDAGYGKENKGFIEKIKGDFGAIDRLEIWALVREERLLLC